MRGASRLLRRCCPLLAQVGERQLVHACKPVAPWAASSCARWATTVTDTGAPLASPDSAGGPLGAYTRGVETGKYRADPQQVRRALARAARFGAELQSCSWRRFASCSACGMTLTQLAGLRRSAAAAA